MPLCTAHLAAAGDFSGQLFGVEDALPSRPEIEIVHDGIGRIGRPPQSLFADAQALLDRPALLGQSFVPRQRRPQRGILPEKIVV